MKKNLIQVILFTLLFLIIVQVSVANDVGTGIGITVGTEQFKPLIWMCDHRTLTDDNTENGANGLSLSERKHNYAFEGEQISWKFLVMDKNKIEQIADVVTVLQQSAGGDSSEGTEVRTQHTQVFCDSLTPLSGTWNRNLTLPKFNSSLGTLLGAVIDFNDSFTANLSFEHTSEQGSAPYTANLTGGVIITPPEGAPLHSDIFFTDSGVVGPFDGVNDFGGTSGKKFENITNAGSHHFVGTDMTLYQSAPGIIDIPVMATSEHEVTGPGDFDTSLKTLSSANACITYRYETTEIIPGSGGESVEVECKRTSKGETSIIDPSCNARIDEENLTVFDERVMAYYICTFTVETPASMYGEYFLTTEVMDTTGLSSMVDETEYWFLNPVLNLGVEGTIDFSSVRPGTQAYSSTVLLRNEADEGSGVMLDMFISGTDFYDPTASGAACPNSNQLSLTNFRYYATNGAFSSNGQPFDTDTEGYTSIPYSTDITGAKRIIRWTPSPRGASPSSSVVEDDWNNGNVLSPGSEMALVFRLALPEPCVGDFSEGQIFFYGEAI